MMLRCPWLVLERIGTCMVCAALAGRGVCAASLRLCPQPRAAAHAHALLLLLLSGALHALAMLSFSPLLNGRSLPTA